MRRDIHFLASEDIFVLPSYREAFGIADLEAMAVGLLTIGVTGQGPSQFIRDGENGHPFAPAMSKAFLVVALRDVLTGDCQRWRKIAREGQHTARNAYTWDHHARQLVSVDEQAIMEKISR